MSDQLFTFDDIPRYAYVRHRGKKGIVTEKGGDIIEDNDGRHIRVQYFDNEHEGNHAALHENIVNKYLRNKKHLWVDFTNNFKPTEATN